MSTREQFFPKSGPWVTNPKHLPIVSVLAGILDVKTTATAFAHSGTSGFFTALAYGGAVSAITVADTYVTVCDLTGSGFFFNAVSPTHSAAFTPTIRLTIDGVVYVIAPTADQTALYRVVVGAMTVGVVAAASGTATLVSHLSGPNSHLDTGFTAASVGGIQQVATMVVGIPTASLAMAYGLPCLRFETGLKVEMKASLLSGTAVDKQCGVTYRLDI